MLRFLADVRSSVLGPVREAATLDAVRGGLRRIFTGFFVYPAGSKAAMGLADTGDTHDVVAPIGRDGGWLALSESSCRVPLPLPDTYSQRFLLESLFAPIPVGRSQTAADTPALILKRREGRSDRRPPQGRREAGRG